VVRNEHGQFEDQTDIDEHARSLRAHLLRVKQTGRPLRVTSNGPEAAPSAESIDAVVLSRAMYEDLAKKAELVETLELIDAGLADVEAGRVVDAREAFRQIAEEHGLRMGR